MNYELRPTSFGELYKPMAPSEVTQRAVTIADMMDKRAERQKATQQDETARDIYKNAADPITGQVDPQQVQAQAYQQRLPEVAQSEQKRIADSDLQQQQMLMNESAMNTQSRQQQLYGQQANNAAYELKLKKYEHGADLAQQLVENNKNDISSPEFKVDYDYVKPVFQEAGMDFLGDFDDSTFRKLQQAAKMGKAYAEKMRLEKEGAQLSGNLPSGIPTEEKRHNLAMEGASRLAEKPSTEIFPKDESGDQAAQDYAASVISGDVSPDLKDLSARGAAGARAKIKVQKILQASGFPVQQELTAYNYWNDPTTIRQRQSMDVVSEQLPKLVAISKEFKRSGIPFIDTKTMYAKRDAGDVLAAKYIAALTATTEDVGKGTVGGQALTDDVIKLANNLMYKGGSPEQIEALAESIQDAVDSRKMTMYKRGGVQAKKYAEQDPWLGEDERTNILKGKFGSSNEIKTSTQHPQDSEAVTWAKQNPNDPRAQKILQLNGK